MTLRAHYEALAAVLKASFPEEVCKVYLWTVPSGFKYPYVLLHGGAGQESTESLCGTPDLLSLRPRVTYAAQTGEQLMGIVDDTRDVLRDRTLSVAGWSPTRLRQGLLIDQSIDFDVTIPNTKNHPVFCTDEFPFTTQRT